MEHETAENIAHQIYDDLELRMNALTNGQSEIIDEEHKNEMIQDWVDIILACG